jgi:hypothetical protein
MKHNVPVGQQIFPPYNPRVLGLGCSNTHVLYRLLTLDGATHYVTLRQGQSPEAWMDRIDNPIREAARKKRRATRR